MTLTLVSAEIGYNIYEDADGNELVGTAMPVVQELTLWEDFDLSTAWLLAVQRHRKVANRPWWSTPHHDDFLAEVRREVADADAVNIVWCEGCNDPTNGETAVTVDDGHACQSCYEDNYRSCDDCGAVVYYANTLGTLAGELVCSRCCDNNYRYCEDCDGYYYYADAGDHEHGGCDCEAPAQHFTMRHGTAVVGQDERFAVTLPAGVISDEGILSIASMLRNHGYEAASEVNPDGLYDGPTWIAACDLRSKWWMLADEVTAMDPRWQTKEGNFTKRLSKLAHKSRSLKIPPELLTRVGNVARDNSSGADLEVEMTRNLNLPAGDFYHEDSCWWQSYSDSRCSLKTNGGIGMRTFDNAYGYERVTGRAWIMPLRLDSEGNLQPTFDAMTADAFMVYNGYGDLSGYVPARIVADMYGMTYRKVGFECSPQYINAGGYLVTTEEIAQRYTASSTVRIYADTHSTLYYDEQAAVRDAALVTA